MSVVETGGIEPPAKASSRALLYLLSYNFQKLKSASNTAWPTRAFSRATFQRNADFTSSRFPKNRPDSAIAAEATLMGEPSESRACPFWGIHRIGIHPSRWFSCWRLRPHFRPQPIYDGTEEPEPTFMKKSPAGRQGIEPVQKWIWSPLRAQRATHMKSAGDLGFEPSFCVLARQIAPRTRKTQRRVEEQEMLLSTVLVTVA